jgi:hypothetical protein
MVDTNENSDELKSMLSRDQIYENPQPRNREG